MPVRTIAWAAAVVLLLAGVAAIIMFSVSLSGAFTMAEALNAPGIAAISGEVGAQGQSANVSAVVTIAAITAGGAIAARQRSKA